MPSVASSAKSSNTPPEPQRFNAGALAVTLRLAGKDYFELTFGNSSSSPIIVLRPSTGEHLVVPRGSVGARALPGAAYRFEARTPDGRVFRDVYANEENLWLTEAESKNAVRAKRGEQTFSEATLKIAPQGTATITADLPFELPPGEYAILFSYSYFLSPSEVPDGWYTGEAEALPLLVEVDASGALALKPAAVVAAAPACDLTLTLRDSQNRVDLAFVNRSDRARVLDIPVDALVDYPLPTATFKWEAVDEQGHVFRAKVGEHSPSLDHDGRERPERPRPEAPTLVVPPRGTATLRAEVPIAIPNGKYTIRVAYDNFSKSVELTDSEWCGGTVVSAPISVVVQR
jgi:hypothetical protein